MCCHGRLQQQSFFDETKGGYKQINYDVSRYTVHKFQSSSQITDRINLSILILKCLYSILNKCVLDCPKI